VEPRGDGSDAARAGAGAGGSRGPATGFAASEGLATGGSGRSGGGRVLVFGLGHASSGIPYSWAAGPASPGVSLAQLNQSGVARVARLVGTAKRAGRNVAVASVHWGSNWGFDVPQAQRDFARALIDDGERD
jgi:poly-gamma-glutamate capsule biosynthesis protein CapA/YwtB (metallophosphatase superfamily)